MYISVNVHRMGFSFLVTEGEGRAMPVANPPLLLLEIHPVCVSEVPHGGTSDRGNAIHTPSYGEQLCLYSPHLRQISPPLLSQAASTTHSPTAL